MAKLVKREVQVEEPHEFNGAEFVTITILSTYDNGAAYPKRHNIPADLVPEVSRKLAAVAKTMH